MEKRIFSLTTVHSLPIFKQESFLIMEVELFKRKKLKKTKARKVILEEIKKGENKKLEFKERVFFKLVLLRLLNSNYPKEPNLHHLIVL